MTINEFRERIIKLRAQDLNGLNGAGSGIVGPSSGADALFQLQRAAIEFTRYYKSEDEEKFQIVRKDLTAKIMVAHAVNAITEKHADELLEDLHQLTKERK